MSDEENDVISAGVNYGLYYDITEFTLPKGMQEVPDTALLACLNLVSVSLPNAVTRIALWNWIDEWNNNSKLIV